MIDIDLVVQALRRHGHTVEDLYPVPENAGDYELNVDGNIMPLAEARRVLDMDESKPRP